MAWVVLGVMAALLAATVFSLTRRYATVFADAHYVEIAQGLERLKTAALEAARQGEEKPLSGPEDARALQTSGGLALVYTISPEANGYVHHYSLSVPGGVTPGAVGQTFTVYIAQLLGVEVESLTTAVSEAGVYHTEFTLNDSEQAAFAARSVGVPNREELAALRARCQDLRESLMVGSVQTRE